jgi:hypothetical protein
MFTKLFAVFFKTVILIVIAAMLVPAGYFAWRMNQPLPQPEFRGLTAYQFLEWQEMHCEQKNLRAFCVSAMIQAYSIYIGAPIVGIVLQHRKTTEPITISNFLPASWEIVEYLFWFVNKTEIENYHLRVPTPIELQAMQNVQQTIVRP